MKYGDLKIVFACLRLHANELDKMSRRYPSHGDVAPIPGGSFVTSPREEHNNRGGGDNERGEDEGEYSRGIDFYESPTDPGGNATVSSAFTLTEVSRKSLESWEGLLYNKRTVLETKFHILENTSDLVHLLKNEPSLRITLKHRLGTSILDGSMMRRICSPLTATILLCLPTILAPPLPEGSLLSPFSNLVASLKRKESAGIIRVGSSDSDFYVFPPCAFSLNLVRRAASSLTEETTKDDYLVIIDSIGLGQLLER